MKILVANLGSTSFKYRLFDMSDPAEPVLRAGSIERIGSPSAKVVDQVGPRRARAGLPDRRPRRSGPALPRPVDRSRDRRAARCRRSRGHRLQGGPRPQPDRRPPGGRDVLAAMEAFADVAPAHNPPYTKAMRMLRDRFPELPLVAAFETGFHRTIPEANQRYAIPDEWATELGVRRWGFHGASHRYIAGRMPELLGRADIKVISCHLGGSSSLCAIRNGAVGRVQPGHEPADRACRTTTASATSTSSPCRSSCARPARASTRSSTILANQSGLEGMSGAGCDLRDIEAAAADGQCPRRAGHRCLRRLDPPLPRCLPARARRGRRDRLHRRHRRELGADSRRASAATSTGSASSSTPRSTSGGPAERLVSTAGSRVQVWTVPTNEEIVVARQVEAIARTDKPKGETCDVPGPGDRQRGGDPEGRLDDGAQAPDRRALSGRRQGARPARADRPHVRRGRHAGRGHRRDGLDLSGLERRLTPETEKLPIDAVVIGLVDTVDVGGKSIFSAQRRPIAELCGQDACEHDSDCSRTTVPAMQMTEDIIRNVVQEVLAQMGNGARSGQRQGPSRVRREPRRLLDRRRRRLGRRGGLPGVPDPAARRPPQGRRVHPQDLRRPGRGAGPGRARRDQDRPARPQDRQAPRRDPAGAGRRVPPHRQRLGRRRPDPDRLRPVRSHRRDHAGDAQPADARGQRDQHAGRPATRSSSTPILRDAKIAAEGVRRFNKAIREAIGLENLLTIIDPPTLESAAALFDHKAVRLLVVTGGPGRRPGRPGQQEAGDRRRAGQSAGRRRRDRLPRKRGQVDRRRRRRSTTTCSASARSRSSPSPRSSTR